jgi:hypothetical protein
MVIREELHHRGQKLGWMLASISLVVGDTA